MVQDPREVERRLLLDTYRTFGCESGQPTFRYSLLDGVKDGVLINPTVVDARTEVTTRLLSEEGFTVAFTDDVGEDQQETFKQREFEKRFFSDATNQVFCTTFMENALRDPISREIGKSIIFCRQPAPRGPINANPQPNGRPHVSRNVPVRLRRPSHVASAERPAIHQKLRQQQPASDRATFCPATGPAKLAFA